MTDNTHFYVDGGSGEIIARRTMLVAHLRLHVGPAHHMDYTQGREDTHNPWVVSFGAFVAGNGDLALILLPLTIRRKNGRNGNGGSAQDGNGKGVSPS